MVCLSVVVKPRSCRGPAQLGAAAPGGKNDPETVLATECQMCEDLALALINSAVAWLFSA